MAERLIKSSGIVSTSTITSACLPVQQQVSVSAGAGQIGGSQPGKPVPMKLFSSWEVDRTPSNCIPRLCTLTLTRLVVIRPLAPSDVSSVLVAVKMAGSRRTLRSSEIALSSIGTIDSELELHFSLQYPHFLKRDENRLFVMLQRRKKYKNRTILGYKTLAEGTIDMAMVIQRSMDLELSLVGPEGGNKEAVVTIAKVTILGVSSHPVDDIEGDRKSKQASGLRRQLSSMNPLGHDSAGKPRAITNDFSDDDDDFSSHSSDSPPDDVIIRKTSKSLPHNRNLKQRIVNLLRKFKASEEGQRSESKSCGPVGDIDELFLDELEGLSDSEPDADTLSMGSYPKKPVLPPFFASSKSLVQQQGYILPTLNSDEKADSDSWTDPEQQPGDSPKLNLIASTISSTTPITIGNNGQLILSASNNAKTNRLSKLGAISDQLLAVLPPDDNFPDLVVFVWLEGPGLGIYGALAKSGIKVLGIENEGDLRVALPHLIGKVQKFCNNNAKTPPPTCFVVTGSEVLLSGMTRTYVAQLTSKPHDWQTFFSFLYIPFSTGGSIWRLLCHSDVLYAQSFNEFMERCDPEECALRIITYVKAASERRQIVNLPIAEAMITYKDNEESSQVFVPFISDVRLSVPFPLTSIELQEGQAGDLSSSPPSPPHSPREDPQELQVDYWKGNVKSSIKAFFRTLHIQRSLDNGLNVTYTLKEHKKQKIMRLGKKKERESDVKNLSLDGISRLVCLAKSQFPIKLLVDGVEWSGVKFFQVSGQWQSQVKYLPLLVSAQGKGEP